MDMLQLQNSLPQPHPLNKPRKLIFIIKWLLSLLVMMPQALSNSLTKMGTSQAAAVAEAAAAMADAANAAAAVETVPSAAPSVAEAGGQSDDAEESFARHRGVDTCVNRAFRRLRTSGSVWAGPAQRPRGRAAADEDRPDYSARRPAEPQSDNPYQRAVRGGTRWSPYVF